MSEENCETAVMSSLKLIELYRVQDGVYETAIPSLFFIRLLLV